MEVTPPKIIEKGEVPTSRSNTGVAKMAVMGVLAGMILCAGVIVVRTIMDDTIKSEEDIEKNTPKNSKNKFMNFVSSSSFKFIIIGLVLALFTIGLIALVSPKKATMNVSGVSWSRTIDIEKYQTVNESDWSLPQNARLLYSNEEIHHYDTVLDHYETKSREVAKERITGYNTYYTYNDLGNGYFEEEEHSEPIYETYYETEYYDEPVYKEVAVYQTKYYYEIDKWLYERSVETSGNDKNPYWVI